jgi:Spy/CpxP family protein refolding chaperone
VSRSTKDSLSREEIVKSYRESRAKIRRELTPEQREKLARKLADEP